MRKLNWCKTACGLCVLSLATAGALFPQTFNVLASFNVDNGNQPDGALVQGLDGSLYGTTFFGGTNNGCGVSFNYGCGTVFKITPAGKLTTLYQFCSQPNCADGSEPVGALTVGTDGNFYGTTLSGTDSTFSTIFKMTPEGNLTTIYSFCRNGCTDGSMATGGLVQGPDGDFYGTTSGGGLFNDQCPSGCGTVFKTSSGGALTTLYRFSGKPTAPTPMAWCWRQTGTSTEQPTKAAQSTAPSALPMAAAQHSKSLPGAR